MLSTCVLLLALNAPFTEATKVDEIRIEGLWFSKQIVVERELTFKAGDTVAPAQWDLTETRLWNLGVFSRVELSLVTEAEKAVAVVKVEDRFPLTPILLFNFGGNQFVLWLGLNYINFLGRAIEMRGFYERFGDQNGFHVHILDPRFLNRRIAAQFEAEWLSRPQPQFIIRRAALRAFVEFNAPKFDDDSFRIGAQVEGNLDELLPVATSTGVLPPKSLGLFVGPMFDSAASISTDFAFARASLSCEPTSWRAPTLRTPSAFERSSRAATFGRWEAASISPHACSRSFNAARVNKTASTLEGSATCAGTRTQKFARFNRLQRTLRFVWLPSTRCGSR